ncbi:MAG: YeiH family protein [Ktedonobacterales bacterium]
MPSPAKRRALWLGGVAFTLVVATLGLGLAQLPGFALVGPLACAILIAVGYRQVAGYPEQLRPGITYSAKRLLRYAIILYGLKLNIDVVLHQGLGLLLRDVGTITFAILVTVLIARMLKADASLSLLLAIGTGVCGAAAIAAVSPILRAEEEDTAIGAGIIALMGTVFAIGYTVLRPLLPLTAQQYGIWSGVSIHEIAQVALAAAPAGKDALAVGLLAKLGRVFLLVPLSFLLVYWMKRRGAHDRQAKIEFPWFLIGFILMSLFGSYVVGHVITVPHGVLDGLSNVTTFLLTMALVGLGLNVHLNDLRTKALRPLIAMTIASLLLSTVTFLTLV